MVSIYNVQYAKINLHRFLLLGVKFCRVNVGVKLRRVNVGVKLRRVNVGVKLRRVNETAECEYSRLNAYTLRYIDIRQYLKDIYYGTNKKSLHTAFFI